MYNKNSRGPRTVTLNWPHLQFHHFINLPPRPVHTILVNSWPLSFSLLILTAPNLAPVLVRFSPRHISFLVITQSCRHVLHVMVPPHYVLPWDPRRFLFLPNAVTPAGESDGLFSTSLITTCIITVTSPTVWKTKQADKSLVIAKLRNIRRCDYFPHTWVHQMCLLS